MLIILYGTYSSLDFIMHCIFKTFNKISVKTMQKLKTIYYLTDEGILDKLFFGLACYLGESICCIKKDPR